MNPTRARKATAFIETFTPLLRQAQIDHPREYGANPPDAALVSERMHTALIRGSYSKDGRAMKATCKALGITHTYKGIEAYLRGETPT